jgi:hypothetical protein
MCIYVGREREREREMYDISLYVDGLSSAIFLYTIRPRCGHWNSGGTHNTDASTYFYFRTHYP